MTTTDPFAPPPASPGRMAGKRGLTESHEPRLMLDLFRYTVANPCPPEWDGTHGITEWGMDGNDQYGCCGYAATDHYDVAKTGNTALIGKLGGVGLPLYFEYGISMGEPGPQPDQGVDNASWLAFLYKKGIIQGYGEVPLSEINQYAYDFNGVLLGVSLDDDAETDFEASPPIAWGSTPGDTPDPTMGHDILLVKYHLDGSGTGVTWGGLENFTPTFRADNITDAWAVFDKQDAQRAGISAASLTAELTAIHGTVSPAS